MLREHFTKTAKWFLGPDDPFEEGRRLRERFDNWVNRVFTGRAASGPMSQEEVQRARELLIKRQAARAVEWNWNRTPDERLEFIRKETPLGGYLWKVTPEEIFDYSQKHFGELLPNYSSPQDQEELESLRRTFRPAPGPAPHLG